MMYQEALDFVSGLVRHLHLPCAFPFHTVIASVLLLYVSTFTAFAENRV